METKGDCTKCPVRDLVNRQNQLEKHVKGQIGHTVADTHRQKNATEQDNIAAFHNLALPEKDIIVTEQQIEAEQKKCGRPDCPHKK